MNDKARKEIEKIRRGWEQYFSQWRTANGSLTWAAVGALQFLHWACSNPKQAMKLRCSLGFWNLEPWEQAVLEDIKNALNPNKIN